MLKRSMHSIANRFVGLILIPVLIIAEYFIYRDAANDLLRIVGMLVLPLLILGILSLMAVRFKMYATLEFYDDFIVQKGFLCKNNTFKYEDYVAIIGSYTSKFEEKKAIIFLKKDGPLVKTIDTSKFGNVIVVNKAKILYCMYDEEILKFLERKYSEIEY